MMCLFAKTDRSVFSVLKRPLIFLCIFLSAIPALMAADSDESKPLVRVAVLQFGTVNWELDVIREHKLAEQNNIRIETIGLASNNAVNVALQGGAADIIVSDWIWVTRQRAAGKLYTFVPYSLAVGALMARPDANISTLMDLQGKQLGVAGGPVGKSWLLMRGYAKRTLGFDLKDMVQPKFGAPPLLNKLTMSGDLPAVINFWHFGARLSAAGMVPVISVADVLKGLGIDRSIPLLGWTFDETWAEENKAAAQGFLNASYAAKNILKNSDEEWLRLKPKTKAKDDATLIALRDTYRDGIPRSFSDADEEAAAKTFALLAEIGGSELVGDSTALTDGTFWNGFQIP